MCKAKYRRGVLICAILLLAMQIARAQTRLLQTKFRCPALHGPIPSLLKDINQYSGVNIEYSSSSLSDKNQTLNSGETTVGAALQSVLKEQKVSVIEKNDKLLIMPAATVLPDESLIEHFPVYGFVQEAERLEPLPFAVIRELPAGPVCQSNLYGYYSLSLPEGRHTLQVSYGGYLARTIQLDIGQPTRMNLAMQQLALPEVRVEAGSILRKDGSSTIDKDQSKPYNNVLGDNDPVRSLYLLPGNIEPQETTGGLMVRGGDPDQSAFLLDGNRVFNPSHLLGEISIINNTSVKSIRQFKGDFPASFGGCGISSVTEVNTKDGNMDRWSGQANAGFLSGAFTIEGPLTKGRTAMMASFRQNWSNPVLNTLDDNYKIHFYDIHFKITHLLDSNNKLMISGYLGKDRLDLAQYDYQNLQIWGNSLGTINWNHVFGPRAFVNSTINISSYRNLAGMKFTLYDDSTGDITGTKAFNNYASISQYEAKTQVELIPSPVLQFRFGGRFTRTVIHPFNSSITPDLEEEFGYYKGMRPLPFSETALYAETEIRLTPDWLVRPGLHFTTYRFSNYTYNSAQPRLFSAWRFNKDHQLFLSYSRMTQYLHQVSSPLLGVNSQFWVPSTALLRPVENDQFDLGYSFKNRKGINLSAELYYKKMNNVTNFAENGNVFYDEDTWEQDILSGKGWSYGTELLASKKYNQWLLQLSYTLSWSWRQFQDMNDGNKYPFYFDRRHNLNVTVSYRPSSQWDLSLLWHFNTGNCLLLPPGITPYSDTASTAGSDNKTMTYQILTSPDSSYHTLRGPGCHRLNFNTNFYFNTGSKYKHKISAGLYDVFQSGKKSLPDIWAIQDDTYSITPSGNRLFRFTWYASYTFSF